MANLHRLEWLRIWELAHRWEGCDPDETDPKQRPAPVRERLRTLPGVCEEFLNVYDSRYAGRVTGVLFETDSAMAFNRRLYYFLIWSYVFHFPARADRAFARSDTSL